MKVASFTKAAVEQTSELSFVPTSGVFTEENPDLDDELQRSSLEMAHKEADVSESDHC